MTASSQLNISKILKILNINAVAQFVLNDYEGIHSRKLCISILLTILSIIVILNYRTSFRERFRT